MLLTLCDRLHGTRKRGGETTCLTGTYATSMSPPRGGTPGRDWWVLGAVGAGMEEGGGLELRGRRCWSRGPASAQNDAPGTVRIVECRHNTPVGMGNDRTACHMRPRHRGRPTPKAFGSDYIIRPNTAIHRRLSTTRRELGLYSRRLTPNQTVVFPVSGQFNRVTEEKGNQQVCKEWPFRSPSRCKSG